MSMPSSFGRNRGRLPKHSYSPLFGPVGPLWGCSWGGGGRGGGRDPWQFESGFGPIFGAPKSGQEKSIGAFSAPCHSRQPAVRTATRVCGILKLTLIVRRRICFGAISRKNARLPRVCRAFGRR